MTTNREGGPPPGWYPDPSRQRAWRWWNGYGWTQFASDPSGVPVLTAHERFAAELKAGRWAKRVLVGYLAIIVVAILVAWADSSRVRWLFHDLRVQWRTGVFQDEAGPTNDTNLYSLPLLALEAAVYVLFLVWQYQAAKTAQLLRLPARRSPGLGVGSWFIPIVNLWFPYQAIRDCLPPGGGRTVVARMWAFYLATSVMLVATDVVVTLGSPLGFVLAAVTVALGAGFVLQGTAAVQRIADGHRRLLFPGSPDQSSPDQTEQPPGLLP